MGGVTHPKTYAREQPSVLYPPAAARLFVFWEENIMDKNSFTNSAGKTFPIVGLSPMEIQRIRTSTEDKFRKAGKRVVRPTYKAMTADGAEQTF